ncbi:MAG: uncharacterized protein QG559_936 [Campylobacterota bacterium]|nr:uncharacterized protein [Campylobacterota bacterium]
MKIGVISDTHRKVKKAKRAIDVLKEEGAEFIVHAGDIVELEVLELLRDSGLRYVAVYGNNDVHLAEFHNDFNLVQEPYFFKLSGLKFKLMHIPFYMLPDADVVIFGHTHKAYVEYINSTLFLNSGEACARDTSISRWSMLEIKEKEFIVTNYSRANKSENIEREVLKFLRETNG